MKSISIIFRTTLIAIIIISCSSNVFAQKIKTLKKISENKSKVQAVNIKTKKFIRDTLFKAYYKKYQAEKSEYDAYRVAVDSSAGDIKLRYFDANNQPSFAPETIIPACKNFIEGDLNNDSCNDLIVSVYHSQNGRPRLDIYCYITQDKKLSFYKMHTIHDLGICKNGSDTSGRFFPKKIENGLLIGQTDCYQTGDPGCCPSLEMITYFKFEDELKFVRQEEKKRK